MTKIEVEREATLTEMMEMPQQREEREVEIAKEKGELKTKFLCAQTL